MPAARCPGRCPATECQAAAVWHGARHVPVALAVTVTVASPGDCVWDPTGTWGRHLEGYAPVTTRTRSSAITSSRHPDAAWPVAAGDWPRVPRVTHTLPRTHFLAHTFSCTHFHTLTLSHTFSHWQLDVKLYENMGIASQDLKDARKLNRAARRRSCGLQNFEEQESDSICCHAGFAPIPHSASAGLRCPWSALLRCMPHRMRFHCKCRVPKRE